MEEQFSEKGNNICKSPEVGSQKEDPLRLKGAERRKLCIHETKAVRGPEQPGPVGLKAFDPRCQEPLWGCNQGSNGLRSEFSERSL